MNSGGQRVSSQLTKNRQAHPCNMTWFCPDNIEIAGQWGFRNIEIRNSLSEWYDSTEKYLHTILPVFILVLWVHIVQMKAFSHFNMAETYYFRDIMSLREAVANFNMHWSLSPSHCSQYVQVQNLLHPSYRFIYMVLNK